MAPVGQRKMSLPPELRIKPERKMALKCALIRYAKQEGDRRAGTTVNMTNNDSLFMTHNVHC
jgi:hypothetical protein